MEGLIIFSGIAGLIAFFIITENTKHDKRKYYDLCNERLLHENEGAKIQHGCEYGDYYLIYKEHGKMIYAFFSGPTARRKAADRLKDSGHNIIKLSLRD